jgi:putative oxidoreductase
MEHRLARHWALPLRIILGISFVISGAPKLFSGAGHQQIQGMLDQLGIPAAPLMAWVVGVVEFLGGVCLLLGMLTWLASALLTIEMIVAMVLVHLPQGFSVIHVVGMSERGPVFGLPGYQLNLLLIAGLLALFLGGPGPLSVDARAGRGDTALHAPWMRRRVHV